MMEKNQQQEDPILGALTIQIEKRTELLKAIEILDKANTVHVNAFGKGIGFGGDFLYLNKSGLEKKLVEIIKNQAIKLLHDIEEDIKQISKTVR